MQQQDHLGVERRVLRADRLGADLRELPVAPLLRALLAEERPDIPELHGLRVLVHPGLDVRASDRRRPLRPQRERASALVLEGEHLLLDDVGGIADRPAEDFGRFEDRRLDLLVAGRLEQLASHADDLGATTSCAGLRVERAGRGLQPGHA
jgi:hypothetical protein